MVSKLVIDYSAFYDFMKFSAIFRHHRELSSNLTPGNWLIIMCGRYVRTIISTLNIRIFYNTYYYYTGIFRH